jgi:hypothetical protein
MSNERSFGKLQNELEINGEFRNEDDRNSFINDLRIIYNLVVEFDREYYGDDEDVDPEDLFENYASITPEILDDIFSGKVVDGEMVSGEIEFMISILDAGDQDDSFGSQGWRYRLGWD